MGIAGMTRSVERAKGSEFPRLARQLFGNVRLEFSDVARRESQLASVRLGTCRLSRLSADRHVVHGENATRGEDCPDMVKIIIQTEGRSWLDQDGRRFPVGPASVVIYDPANPYTLLNPEAVELLMLQVPRSRLKLLAKPRRRPMSAKLVAGGMHRILLSMMESTMTEVDALEEPECVRLGDSMVDLVETMVSATPERPAPHSLDILRMRIKDYVAANLARPQLCAQEIARRMGCSLRYVHKAFEADGITLADYIWSERLTRAAAMLSAEPLVPGSIGEVAFSLGFASSAHFSRAFRNQFHQTPTEWSRAARM